MGGKKIQFGMLAGLIVGTGALFQTSLPQVANNAGLLYLRAEYNALTGDAASALQLMQKVAGSKQTTASAPATPAAAAPRVPSQACRHATAAQPMVSSVGVAPVGARIMRVRIPAANGRLQEVVLNVPGVPSSAQAQIRAAQMLVAKYGRQSQHNLQLEAKMRELETRMKEMHLPVPAPPVPPVEVSLQ